MKPQHEPEIVIRNAAALEFHPLLDRISMPDEVIASLKKRKVKKPEHRAAAEDLQADLTAFYQTLDQEGIRDTIKITKGRLVVDGRNRILWARDRGIEKVRCEIVSDEEASRIIETMMIGKRQFTKAMRAYAAVLLHPEVVEAGKPGPKRRDNSPIESANTHGASDKNELSRAELGSKFGVSRDLIDQACKLYEAFEHSKTLREKHEKLVWAGFGLGGIIAGLAGDRTDQSITQMDFLQRSLPPLQCLRRLAPGELGEDRDP